MSRNRLLHLSLLFIILAFPVYAGQKVTGNLQVTGLGGGGTVCLQSDNSGNVSSAGAGCGTSSSQWTTTNTNDVYLPNNGNVGLGTTITQNGALLVMNGNIGIGTWVPNRNVQVDGGAGGSVISLTNNSTGHTVNDGYYFGYNGQAYAWNYENSPFSIATNNTERVTVLAGGNVGIGTTNPQGGFIVLNGNVGIGTWKPESTLDIASGGTDARILLTNSVSGYGGGNGLIINNDASTAYLWNYESTPLLFGTANTEKMRITSGGNVGIGSTVPGTILDVFGSMRVLNSGHITTEGVTSTGATGTNKFVFDTSPTLVTPVLGAATYTTLSGGAVTDSALTSGRVTFASTAGLLADDSDLTFATDTLTATKIAATTFTGSITTVGISNGTTAITNSAAYTQSGTSVNLLTGNTSFSANVGIGTTAAQAALSVMSGNVGIGTYAPTQALQVNGAINTYGNTSNTTLNTTGGNVGIGTTVPNATLEIKGLIRTIGSGTSTTTVKAAANQACNTTCNLSMCLFGEDTIGLVMLDCTNATSDTCLCLGP